jgi:hypothetical protein
MATQKVCDHCDKAKPSVRSTAVAVSVDGLAVENQTSGLELRADLCDECREPASTKMHAAAHKRLKIGAPAHQKAINNRAACAEKSALIRAIQTRISKRDSQTATPDEVASIEQLTAECDELLVEADKVLADATKQEDQIKAW